MIRCESNARMRSGGQRLLAAVFAMWLLLPGQTNSQTTSQTPSEALVIPFAYSSHRASLLVRVSINGKRGLLVLDTGSAHTIVRPELVGIRRSQLQPAGAAQSGAAFIGDAVGAEVTLQVGDRIWPKYRVVSMDLSQILSAYGEDLDGVLGIDFLQKFSRVEIDLHNHRIELKR